MDRVCGGGTGALRHTNTHTQQEAIPYISTGTCKRYIERVFLGQDISEWNITSNAFVQKNLTADMKSKKSQTKGQIPPRKIWTLVKSKKHFVFEYRRHQQPVLAAKEK